MKYLGNYLFWIFLIKVNNTETFSIWSTSMPSICKPCKGTCQLYKFIYKFRKIMTPARLHHEIKDANV